MSPRRLPEIPERALRDYESSEQVKAVWRRLKTDLRARPSVHRSSFVWAWAPALSAVLFGSGVFVGARFIRPQALPGVRAEPPTQLSRAAGPVPSKNAVEPEVLPPQIKALRAHARHSANAHSLHSAPLGEALDDASTYIEETPAPAPEWQHLVEIGDFPGARRALDQQGGFDVAIAHASPAELMSLVDIARASGERGQAASALRQVLAHPEAPEAPLAAWTLGNLLDQAGDEPGAAQAFALYRRLSPAGDFAEDAAARQIDVALADGNAELVRQLVEDYAQDFPQGRRRSEFRRAEQALVARATDAGLAGPGSSKPDVVHEDPEDEPDETQSPAGPSAPGPASKDAR
jgi:hypothetical protein